eukprot:CFRG6918T1
MQNVMWPALGIFNYNLSVVVFLGYLCSGHASRGDQSQDFQICVRECIQDNTNNVLATHLSLLGWTQTEDCRYTCMHRVTKYDKENERPIRQFYGKWPFTRIFGIQEPASVLASILNALAHIWGIHMYRKAIPAGKAYECSLRTIWLTWSLFSINAWVWSTIFHCRDTPFTEKMDYFSATAVILFQTYVAARHTEIITSTNWTFPLTLLAFFVYHVRYLTLRHRFDYSYNMTAMITIALIHSLWWIVWCTVSYSEKKHVAYCISAIAITGVCMMLEIFDFPPLGGHFDAHSLWHFGTVPAALLWYRFLVLDVRDIEHID